MRASDFFILSLRQLRERKLRSILTFLAVAVGVTSIVALSAMVEGVSQSITQNLQTLGPDTIMITAQSAQFTEPDVLRLKSLEGVSEVIPMMNTRVEVTGMEGSVSLVGLSSFDLVSFLGETKLVDGSIYHDVSAPQVVLGHNIAVDDTGVLRYRVGQPILVQMGSRSTTMTVIGILDTYGASFLFQTDDSVFMPAEYGKTLLRSGAYTFIIVKTESSELVNQVAEIIGYVFGGRARVTSVAQLAQTVTSIMSQMNLLLLAISGTSFIAAGLGTFNVMMISVLERVREIGIVKALGMKDRGVLMLYITQGLLLGIFGSIVGIALGSMTAYVIPALLTAVFSQGGPASEMGQGMGAGPGAMGQSQNMMILLTPVISTTYLGIAVALSIVVTLLSSAYPSWKASRMSPVDALRYE